VAVAIGLAVSAPAVLADNWDRNVKVFVHPGTERNVYGGALLQPVWQNSNALLYGDLRGNFARPSDTEELNFGLGYRYLSGTRGWVFGGWASADVRDSRRDNIYSQVSWGAEALGPVWDARLNFYYPLTDEKRVRPWPTGGFFQGNRLFTSTVMEEALRGVDVEVGALLPIDFAETRLYVGGHHFAGDIAPDANGAKVRLEVRPVQSIILGLSYEYDDEFDDEVFFQLQYEFGYPFKRERRSQSNRMIQFAERDVDVRVTDPLPDSDMLSATPEHRSLLHSNVVHIDNSAAPDGDGSFERPYNSFVACFAARCMQNGALVYVHAGDGTLNGYDQTFNLVDNQRLIGQGFSLYGIGGDRVPIIGPTSLPDSIPLDGVVLANNNEVAGLRIDNSTNAAIVGLNVTNFDIHGNLINSLGHGIEIETQADSTEGSQVSQGRITGNRISAGRRGISLENRAEDGLTTIQAVTVANNVIRTEGVFFDSAGVNIFDRSSGDASRATQTALVANNVISTTGDDADGVFINVNAVTNSDQATQTVTLLDNTISTTGDGASGVAVGNFASYDQNTRATQMVRLIGNGISTTGTNANGVSIGQRAVGNSRASQMVALRHATISTAGDVSSGLNNNNIAQYGTAQVTQSVSLVSSTVNTLGINGTGVRNTNQASNDNAQANQMVTLVSSTISSMSDFAFGVANSNNAINDAAQADQTVTLERTGVSTSGAFGRGVNNSNGAIGGDAWASQAVTLTGATVNTTGDTAHGLFSNNNAVNGNTRATQTVALTNSSVTTTGPNADGVLSLNSAALGTVEASQTLDLGAARSRVTSAQAYGVNANNSNGATPPGFATQLLDLTGATISGALGNVLTTGDPTQTVVGI
jgi:hypothetical protein